MYSEMYTEFLLSLSQNFIRKKLPLEGVFSYSEYFQLLAEILISLEIPAFQSFPLTLTES